MCVSKNTLDVIPWLDHGIQKIIKIFSIFNWTPWSRHGVTHKANFITIGNLEYDLDLIKECDLVIEVIVEKLEIKHQLYNKIIPYLKEDAIIASNTSTLPLERLKENLSDNIKSRFVITHFFNPPR